MTATITSHQDLRAAQDDFRTYCRERIWTKMADAETMAALEARFMRAWELPGTFLPMDDGNWGYVKDDASTCSGLARTHAYVVSETDCSCPDSQTRAHFTGCKHVIGLSLKLRADRIRAEMEAELAGRDIKQAA